VSGVWVVEADTTEGHNVDGIASLRALEVQHGALPPTLTARSPSGSLHHYFRYPANGAVIKNSTSKLAPGVDVRGKGGMVLAPPSLRSDGAYTWINNVPPANPPEWLVQLSLAASADADDADDDAPTPIEALTADPARIAAAVNVIPNDDLSWEDWNYFGMAIYGGTGGSEAGFTIFDRFSQKSKKYDAANTRAKWKEFRKYPPNRIGAGTLFYLANEANSNWEIEAIASAFNLGAIIGDSGTSDGKASGSSTSDEKDSGTSNRKDSGTSNGKESDPSTNDTKPKPKPGIATPYVLRNLNTVCIRAGRWLWRGHLPAGALELT